LQQTSNFATVGVNPGASIHPEARLEPNVIVDPGAVIGPQAEIGGGTLIGANCVIGPSVRIGRNCKIGPLSFVSHALLGNRVTLHSGTAIGQDTFGFSLLSRTSTKLPHAGRVILQDEVEIGANSVIDRGMAQDTIIGEGTKIDSLVRIASDVRLGRFCLIYAQSLIGEGARLGDFSVLGGQAGVAAHVEMAANMKIAPQSGVYIAHKTALRLAGTPAQPLWQWLRETGFQRFARRQHRKI
jgi:UDP-3-O-[3-hydroxymyristoyl] glucosamine N-acyltransferase